MNYSPSHSLLNGILPNQYLVDVADTRHNVPIKTKRRRLSHLNFDGLRKMQEDLRMGIAKLESEIPQSSNSLVSLLHELSDELLFLKLEFETISKNLESQECRQKELLEANMKLEKLQFCTDFQNQELKLNIVELQCLLDQAKADTDSIEEALMDDLARLNAQVSNQLFWLCFTVFRTSSFGKS